MTQWVSKLAQSTFLRHNAILLGGAVAVGVLNYAFYPVVARQLTPAAFGEVQAVISLFLQLSMFLTVLTIVTMYVVTNYSDIVRRNTVIFELEKIALIIVTVLFVATLICSEQLRLFFKFESVWPFVLLGAMMVITVPFTFYTSFLRGVKRVVASTAANLISAAGKFVFALTLVMFGLGTSGALLGVFVAQACAFAYAAWQAKKAGLVRAQDAAFFTLPHLKQIVPELKYSAVVLVGSLAVMLQLTIDVLVVKHFFDAHTAGLYAGVATIARIIFFLTASITQVLLPSVHLRAERGQNTRRLLLSLALMVALSLPVLGLFALFPQAVVSALMGGEYAGVAHLLPQLSLTIFIMSVLNLLVSYYLALKKYAAGAFALIGCVVTCGLVVVSHASLDAVVYGLFLGSALSVVLIVGWIIGQKLAKRGKA